MKTVRQFFILFCCLSVIALVQPALASDPGSVAAEVAAGEYSLSNQWERARQRLTFLQQVCDSESQQRIRPFLKPGGHYLEVGPGLGSMTRFLAEQAGDHGRVLAVDIDNTFLDEVKAIGSPVETVLADITSLDPGVGQFDFIYARLVFMHLTKNDNQVLINKLVSALKPGGYLFIDDFVEGANINRFQAFSKVDPRLPAYAVAIYRKMSGHMDFDQGYLLAGMMSEAGLVDVDPEISMKRVQGGGVHAGVMQMSLEQIGTYLLDIPDHHDLFPMLMKAWENPDLHWYDHGRVFVVGQKP